MKLKRTSFAGGLQETSTLRYFPISKTVLFILISIILVIIVNIWYVSFGVWTRWWHTTEFYDQLATAFAHGSLSLEAQVDPALLLLTNPYDPNEREGINYPLDYSLYKGKYYLYFGPVPALLLAIFKLLGFGTIGDQYLVFFFSSGWFIFQSLSMIEIRKQFFPDIPDWMLPICIAFGGLISPLGWMLTEARVYEAASTGGQCFFLAGLYFNIRALAKDSKLPGRFLIGSTLWAFSLGSRLTQALPIGFFTLTIFFLCVRSYFQTKSLARILFSVVSLGLPLVTGMVLLGWYNWARFDSVFETGYSYQLTRPNLRVYRSVIFSPIYILPNSYEYLAGPPKIDNIFPFLHPVRTRGYLLFPDIELPKVYNTRAMTGIMYSTPFVLFAGIALIPILFPKLAEKNQPNLENGSYSLKWIAVGLLGSFLFGFIPIVTFFWVVTRYSADFSPSLILLSMIGFWLGYRFFARWFIFQKVYAAVGIGLMVISVVISNLLVLSIREPFFQAKNFPLWNWLITFFSP